MTTNQSPRFQDLKSEAWELRLDFAALYRIRDGAGVDLGNVEQLAQTWAELLYDEAKALDVLWLAMETQAKARGLDKNAFHERMDGHTLESALDSLGVAVLSFIPPRKRGMAEKGISGVVAGMKQAVAQAEKQIEDALTKSTKEALGTQPRKSRASLVTSTTAGR